MSGMLIDYFGERITRSSGWVKRSPFQISSSVRIILRNPSDYWTEAHRATRPRTHAVFILNIELSSVIRYILARTAHITGVRVAERDPFRHHFEPDTPSKNAPPRFAFQRVISHFSYLFRIFL